MNLVDLVHSIEPEMRSLLGTDEEDTREFSAVCLYALKKVRNVEHCTPRSVAASVLLASKFRLVPGLGLGYFAVEKDEKKFECVFVPKWQGLVELLREHANVVDVQAFTVHANDTFVDVRGSRHKLYFRPSRGERGPLVAVCVDIMVANASGAGGHTHREVLYKRGDIDPVMPDGTEPPESPRSESQHDYYERVKTVALKRAAKWFACGPEICAAIELERASEKSKVRPRAEDVAVMLGIPLPDYTHATSGGPEASSRSQPKAPSPDVPASSGPPAVFNRGSAAIPHDDFEAAMGRVVNDQKSSGDNPLKLRCCGCGNVEQVFRSKVFALASDMSDTCKTGTTARGSHHDLCGDCRDQHYSAWTKFNVEKEAKKHEKASKRFKAAGAATAETVRDSRPAASSTAKDSESKANDGPAEAPDLNTNREASNGSESLVSTSSAGPPSVSSGGAA